MTEIPTKVRMTIMLDDCIAEEIKTLIEKYAIRTEACCCGHCGGHGYVIVCHSASIDKMTALGYQRYTGHRNDSMHIMAVGEKPRRIVTFVAATFKLKTRCRCPERCAGWERGPRGTK